MSGLTEGIDSRMFKLLSGILSKNGDRKDRSLVRGRSARHPWSLVRMLGRYDAATTTIDNVRHWAAADGLSASAANSPEVRRTLRNRSRYEVANNSYARGISLTLANDCVGTGPRLQMLTADAFANRFVEQEFFAWADAAGLAEKLRTMRLARVSDGESFGLLTSNPRVDSPVQLDLKLVEAEQVTSPILALDSYRYLDGIRFDEHGNPISYDVLRGHPGDDAFSLTENYDTIDASSILHYFRSDRPGQIRGIPDITPALPLFAQLRRFTLAVLAAAETAADFAGILYTDAPAGGEADAAEPFEPIELEKRALLTMPGGWKMAQMHAEQPATTYAEFKREILNEIARCLNMPFKKGIREALFLVTTPFTRWVAISGRRSSPAFAGCSAAPVPNGIGNSLVTLAGDRVGQPVEGLGNAQTLVWPFRRSNKLSQLCAIF